MNWCPGLGTVLANEEVTADGRSERGNFPVFKRNLKQWMMRITAYGDRLLDDLDTPGLARADQADAAQLDRPLHRRPHRLPDQPRRRSGCSRPGRTPSSAPPTWCWRPSTSWSTRWCRPPGRTGTRDAWTGGHASPRAAVEAYRKAAAAKTDVERQADTKEKTGVFIGAYATNPVTGGQIPIFIADYVLAGYGTGAIMAVPAQDERDWAFAEVFELPIVRTVQPAEGFDGKAYTGDGPAINSAAPERGLDLNGLGVADAKAAIIAWLEANGHGTGAVTYRLRDWLFSRQRYWGEPFPIVYDETGAAIALPEEMLPVELPEVDDFSPKTFDPDDADSNPETPLSRRRDWVEVELDLGDGPKRYTRETNVMPQWAGSCWYELRYLDPTNSERFVDAGERAVLDGPARRRATAGAPTCTSAAPSTPCCTCCTPGSGTRCCSTWATCRRSSRSASCSTRA